MNGNNDKIGSNERFVRWQGVLREHVNFLNNLLLALSIGIIGYLFSLLKDESFNLSGYKKVLFTLSVTVIFLSTVLGIIATLTRLLDFKATLKKVKTELLKTESSDLEILKKWMGLYGKTTWNLLYWQIGTFLSGMILITITLCFIYNDKLF